MGTPLTRTKKENSTNDFEHRGRKHREVARPVQTSHSAKRSRKDWRREKDESRRYTRNLRHIESALDDTVTALPQIDEQPQAVEDGPRLQSPKIERPSAQSRISRHSGSSPNTFLNPETRELLSQHPRTLLSACMPQIHKLDDSLWAARAKLANELPPKDEFRMIGQLKATVSLHRRQTEDLVKEKQKLEERIDALERANTGLKEKLAKLEERDARRSRGFW